MEGSIGLLSNNTELVADFKSNYSELEVRQYKSVESIKPDEIKILVIDAEFFDTLEGIQFYLSRIRKKIHVLPVVLILRTNIIENIDLEWFFNEFILYPFRKGELSIRLKKLTWDNNLFDDENILSVGNIKINLKEYSIYLNNEKQDFTYKEFELLRLLVENKGVVFSRKDLLGRIWGLDYIGGTRTVDVHIRRLRAKLGEEFNTIIETVRNVGYRCKA